MTTSGEYKLGTTLPALLLMMAVLAGTCAPVSHAEILDQSLPAPSPALALVNLTIDNHLCEDLNVTVPGAFLGSTQTVVVPPNETRTVPIEPQGPLLGGPLVFKVLKVLFSPKGNMLLRTVERAAAEGGIVKIVVTTPCKDGETYLSDLLVSFFDVAVQIGTSCATPI